MSPEETDELRRRASRPESATTDLLKQIDDLRARLATAEARLQKSEDRRKAIVHILADYERDRRRLAMQSERLENSRRALLHILQDVHASNLRLERTRKAMIHIMGDLNETTAHMQRREAELRSKQEQLIQAGKLATLGELTTGIAHELNNPLNNVALFLGNAADRVDLDPLNRDDVLRNLGLALQQVRKATEIISHLRTFGRATTVNYEVVILDEILMRSLSLLQEQFRLRHIDMALCVSETPVRVVGNAIQLEQVFINLLTNARDAVADAERREVRIRCVREGAEVAVLVRDTGPGVQSGLEQRIFDPFFTTKEVGSGTGLGLSITYGIVKDHRGTITVRNHPHGGAEFSVRLPLADGGPAGPEGGAR